MDREPGAAPVPLTRYLDFVLLADQVKLRKGQVASFVVRVFSSPAGEGEHEVRVRWPADLAPRIGWLDRRQIDADLGAQIELGTVIGTMLLPIGVRGLFEASLGRLAEDEGLRVRLRLGDALADVPWEFAWVERHRGEPTAAGFLALDPRISIVRHEAVAAPLPEPAPAAAGRRVVVATASPDGYPPLPSLAAERAALGQALDGVAGITADVVADATPAALLDALAAGADVFHFSGHGTPDGGVVLAGGEVVPGDRLAEMVQAKGVRLAVLGACDTGRRDDHNVWGGVAAALVQRGVPAVVAMQFTIGDRRAAAFAGALYRALVAGLTVDEAVALGRTAIRTVSTGAQAPTASADVRDWVVPVLYLRDHGGRVFEPVSSTAAREEAEAGSARLYRQRVGTVSAGGVVLGAVLEPDASAAVDQDADRVDGTMIGVLAGDEVRVDQDVEEVGTGGTVVGGADSPEALARALDAVRRMAPKDGG
ncbi:MAG: hypothetical protein QOG43_240 [Actinomycetota bacterium]|jgi:hypothetical protein|nr:hypothetical protein [Actinomycetota bacterium]